MEKIGKLRIFELEDGDQIIKGEEPLKSYITEYYKELFGPSDSVQFSLDENIRSYIPQISPEENEELIVVFTEKRGE
jgi:hypothetical protein